MGRAGHEIRKTQQIVDFVTRTAALRDLVHHFLLHGRSDPAGRTESATLMREEMGEVARHLEDVAIRTEDHEGSGRRNVLEGDNSAEFVGRDQNARGAAHLHSDRRNRAAIPKYLAYRHAEFVFVD